MTLKTTATGAYDTIVAATNAAAAASHLATLQTAARAGWANILAKLATCAVTGGTPTVININAGISQSDFAKLATGLHVDIGTLAQYQAGSGGATTNNAIISSDFAAKTITLTSACGRAIAVTDFVFVNGVYAPIAAASWATESVISDIATLTLEAMNFRWLNTPAQLQVQGHESQGASTWLPLSSITDLGQYLEGGKVT